MASTDQACENEATSSERLPTGFRFSGVACGIKPSGKPDLSLIVSDSPVVGAGVYTQNQIVAAPVVLSRARTPSTAIRAVVTNSGNANACTGEVGMRDAEEMCRDVAARIGCDPSDVLVMSTGVIGQSLPMDCVRRGIADATANLAEGMDAFASSADAIRTTDKDRKTVCRTIPCGGREISIAAMAKGAGMIAPNMATMLAVILTDAPLSTDTAQAVLSEAADKSFNCVSVDGHTSTNDTLLLLSSGQDESLSDAALETFQRHVNEVSIELAKMLVADGEGATHVMAIRVYGAEDDKSARTIAETVAASPLVKTAITGGDPNWGRIVSAAGYADAKIKPDLVSLRICGQTIYENGAPLPMDEASLSREMKRSEEIAVELSVGDGTGEARFWSSDLTTEYVEFNSLYTT
jgi:glutamate N-acetyltransferase/amino-acid N-acetyltransferase